MGVQGLAKHLYDTFWERNEVKVPPFEEQAKAIINMWTNIARSAIEYEED